jgi:photosystem II stability/assembly factor-like uncharacterized protein
MLEHHQLKHPETKHMNRTPTRCILRLERLEDRTVLSTTYPLSRTQWTALGPAPINVNNPNTGRVSAVDAHPTDPNTIYIATASGGVWKTTNGGAHWRPLTDDQATLYTGAIALAPSNPDIVYVGTGEANYGPSKDALRRENVYSGRGILKSTDAGASWTLLGAHEFHRRTISKVVIHPLDPNIVYVAVGAKAFNGLDGNTGIWFSDDGGLSWTRRVRGIIHFSDFDAVSDLIMDPTDPEHLYAAVGNPYGSLANGVYESFNGGETWSVAGDFPTGAADANLGRITLAVAPSSPQILYAAVARKGASASLLRMMKSTNGGDTWATLPGVPNYMGPFGDYNTTLIVDPSTPNIVIAGGQSSILRTKNGGASWHEIAVGPNVPHPDHHGMDFDADGKLIDGNDGGVWRLVNRPRANPIWKNINGDLNTVQFVGIALDPSNFDIAYGGTQDNGTVKFNDNIRWNRIQGGDGGFTRVDFTTPTTVYATFQYTTGTGFLRRSDNGGTSFSGKTNGINTSLPGNFYPLYVLDPANSNRLLFGNNRVYETLNRGDNWTALSVPFTNGWTTDRVIDSVAAAPTNVSVVYAAAGGHVFITDNKGTTWRQSNPTTPNPLIRFRDLEVDPSNHQVAYVVADNFGDVTGGGRIWVTFNFGRTWTDISGNLPDVPIYSIAVHAKPGQDTLYVGTDEGVFFSNNGGATWTRPGNGLPHVQIHDLELNVPLGILAAGTHGRGMWQLQVAGGGRDSFSFFVSALRQARTRLADTGSPPETLSGELKECVIRDVTPAVEEPDRFATRPQRPFFVTEMSARPRPVGASDFDLALDEEC